MWAAVERANNFTRLRVIVTRDVHIVTLARYDDGHRARREVMAQGRGDVGQGASRPSTGSTGATVTILARELRAELRGHSFIPRIDRTRRGHNVLREDRMSSGLRKSSRSCY